MTPKIIHKIVKEKIPCYFISPHMDDAVLSAGGLMLECIKHDVPVTVINVFTNSGDGVNTLSATQYLKQSKATNAEKLFKLRREEDNHVLSLLGAQVINLNETDALWRKLTRLSSFQRILGQLLPELLHIYPTYRWHIARGKISSADKETRIRLKKRLLSLVSPSGIVFCPYGIGDHVDHVLVRGVCSETFGDRVVYWSDFPYNSRTENYGRAEYGWEKIELKPNLLEKIKLLKLYKTQFQGLFPDGNVPFHNEIFFTKKV